MQVYESTQLQVVHQFLLEDEIQKLKWSPDDKFIMSINVKSHTVHVRALSTDVIEDQTRAALTPVVSDFRINWVWMPPWGPDKITDDGRDMLRALGFNV